MKMAAGLLMNSSYSVHEIMEQCGLNNTTYFYKKFREFYGCTPYAYKQKEGGSSGKSE
jgi:AraC-like DNA-binding protein